MVRYGDNGLLSGIEVIENISGSFEVRFGIEDSWNCLD